MDSSSDRPRASLPPLKLLDLDQIKREEREYQNRSINMTPSSIASSSAPSPSCHYPSGPPPPYSHPMPPSSEARTPPQARRPSAEEQEKQHPKQSLPSIHEALGVDQSRSYPTQPPYTTAPQPPYQASGPPSPPTSRKSFAMDPPPPPMPAISYSHTPRSPLPLHRPSEVSPRTAQDHFESRPRPTYAGAPPPPPSSAPPPRTGYSPVHHPAPYPHTYSRPEAGSVQHNSSMPPPPAPPFSYGYTSVPGYQPRASFAAPYAGPATSTVYQPSVTQPAPVQHDAARHAVIESARNVYGESIKRHLDMYDFEAALNEIAENSSYALEFSRQLGARLHQTQRSGLAQGTLPGVHEIDDLMARSRHTLESLGRMREVIVAQHAAYYQQAQEQQFKAQDEAKRDSVHQMDETKAGGFAGAEAKKRRGRAAPPGRCHSCNRAETPEWRRGPDGARTLCNACGLHYAKLTRKQGAQKASVGSSNLRPKAGASDQQSESNI